MTFAPFARPLERWERGEVRPAAVPQVEDGRRPPSASRTRPRSSRNKRHKITTGRSGADGVAAGYRAGPPAGAARGGADRKAASGRACRAPPPPAPPPADPPAHRRDPRPRPRPGAAARLFSEAAPQFPPPAAPGVPRRAHRQDGAAHHLRDALPQLGRRAGLAQRPRELASLRGRQCHGCGCCYCCRRLVPFRSPESPAAGRPRVRRVGAREPRRGVSPLLSGSPAPRPGQRAPRSHLRARRAGATGRRRRRDRLARRARAPPPPVLGAALRLGGRLPARRDSPPSLARRVAEAEVRGGADERRKLPPLRAGTAPVGGRCGGTAAGEVAWGLRWICERSRVSAVLRQSCERCTAPTAVQSPVLV